MRAYDRELRYSLTVMNTADNHANHFDPVYLPTWILVAVIFGVSVVMVVLNSVVLLPIAPAVLVSAASVFAVLSAFLAGNMYRLGDMRARMGLQARLSGVSQKELLAALPPLRVVRFRFKVSGAGFGIALLMLVASVLSVPFKAEDLRPVAAAAVLGLAASAIGFVCGLWSRPID